jgi:hypothetical protein
MSKKTVLKALAAKLVPFGFKEDVASLRYLTRYNEVFVGFEKDRISVTMRCFPLKEGWAMKEFNKTTRGINAAVRFAAVIMNA